MYKLLIIDDEKLIREGLVDYIDWASLNIEIIGIARDGEEGWEKILALKPDIILSDINMPNLDGLKLLEKIKNQAGTAKVVFISAYSDFKYAHTAIRLGAMDYLLKPIEKTVLYECMKRCILQLEPRPSVHEHINREYAQTLLYSLFTESAMPNKETIDSISQLAGFCIQSPETLGVLLYTYGETDIDIHTLFNSCKAFLEIKISQEVNLFLADGKNIDIDEMFHEVKEKLIQAPVLSYCFRCGDIPIIDHYINAARKIIFATRNKAAEQKFGLIKFDASLPFDDIISKLDNKLTSHYLYLQMDYMMQQPNYNYKNVRLKYTNDIYKICHFITQNYGNVLPHLSYDLPDIPKQLTAFNNIIDLFFYYQKMWITVIDELNHLTLQNKTVVMALQYIHENYNKNLTLNSMAEYLHISPSYFSKLFKENNGCTFSDYLMKYRIEAALKLIQSDNLKIYEIAEQVGYHDVVQFTKMFKKMVGYTPKQWGKRNF